MNTKEKKTAEQSDIEVIWGSTQGAAHKVEDRPCQDIVSIKTGTIRTKPYTLCVMCDGHGHKSHPKSDEGACFAALAAEQALVHFLCAEESKEQQ